MLLTDEIKKEIELEMISIYNSLIPKIKPLKPTAIYVCGITASGKSSLVNSLINEFFEPDSYILINPDDFLLKLSFFKPDLLNVLYPYVSYVTIKIIEPMAFNSGFNLIFDKVCRYSTEIIQKLKLLKKLNYTTILCLNYVSLKTAKQRLHERNLTNLRKIPISILNSMYATITDEFKKYMNINVDELRLYNSENFPASLIFSKTKLITLHHLKFPFYFNLNKYI